MASTQFFIFAILAVLVPSILGTDFVVGDDKGWTNGFDYQTWADGKEFHVGDQLLFNHKKGVHNVFKVNGTDFQRCNASAGSVEFTSGNDVIPLKTPGKKWYICCVPNDCENGNQKLAITVFDGQSPAPSPTSAARRSVAPVYYGWMVAFFGILMMVMV
ncbi:mavicyanin-like [Quercus lobata]|uniref:mavicyanin-like n=1 Tax=Quercus lobata TaxID=97700 RepID=UPI0012458CD2|nr:mavicyanin-like [Quercus lobata]